MKIGIIGSGYVGLVTGACFSHLGHDVICVDNDAAKIKLLKDGKSPIYEPGLEEMVQTGFRRGKIAFTTEIKKAVDDCEVLFICVNTPPKENGEADLSFIEDVSRSIASLLKQYRLIVEKSTVPVQTGEWIRKTIQSIQPDESLFDVASNPEFLREGTAVHDFLNPDRVILGVENAKSETILKRLYEPFASKIVVTDLKSAEIIKHASNSFLATKISFINGVSRICEASGADIEKVALGMGLDPRIGSSFLRAGIGFGGFCFPKDLAAFYHMSEKLGFNFSILKEALVINDAQQDFFVSKIKKVLGDLKEKTLGVLGISFKPETDDIRFSPAINIIKKLQETGCHIKAYDPEAMNKAKAVLPGVKFAKNPYEAIENADALVVLTEWDEFKALDFNHIKESLKTPIVFDGRNMYKPEDFQRLGFQYHGIGRKVAPLSEDLDSD